MVFVRFFGRTENFLQDWLDFLWDYWKLKFSQKKSRQICLLFRNNCLWKNNSGCPFLGGKESFLPDFLKFLWDYSKWNIHRKKGKSLCDQLQRRLLVPIKKLLGCWEIHKTKIGEVYFDSPFIVVSLPVVDWYYLQESLWV